MTAKKTKKIIEPSTEQVRTLLTGIATTYLEGKFKLTDEYKELFNNEVERQQLECDNLRTNGQSYDKETKFLKNVKKVVETLEKNKKPVGKGNLSKKVKEDDTYLYALLMNLEKQGIIEKNE